MSYSSNALPLSGGFFSTVRTHDGCAVCTQALRGEWWEHEYGLLQSSDLLHADAMEHTEHTRCDNSTSPADQGHAYGMPFSTEEALLACINARDGSTAQYQSCQDSRTFSKGGSVFKVRYQIALKPASLTTDGVGHAVAHSLLFSEEERAVGCGEQSMFLRVAHDGSVYRIDGDTLAATRQTTVHMSKVEVDPVMVSALKATLSRCVMPGGSTPFDLFFHIPVVSTGVDAMASPLSSSEESHYSSWVAMDSPSDDFPAPYDSSRRPAGHYDAQDGITMGGRVFEEGDGMRSHSTVHQLDVHRVGMITVTIFHDESSGAEDDVGGVQDHITRLRALYDQTRRHPQQAIATTAPPPRDSVPESKKMDEVVFLCPRNHKFASLSGGLSAQGVEFSNPCMYCSQSLEASAPLYGCTKCTLAMCAACREQSEAVIMVSKSVTEDERAEWPTDLCVCRSGHALSVYGQGRPGGQDTRFGYFCDACDCSITAGDLHSWCRVCKTHICARCVLRTDRMHKTDSASVQEPTRVSRAVQSEGVARKCPGNHALEQLVPTSLRYVCDLCDEYIAGPVGGFQCRSCNYDICSRCYHSNVDAR